MSYITEVDLLDEAKQNFLTYSSEVLCDRAVPSAEDGLLSSQRKLIWTMIDHLKMNSKGKTKKCNAIVGSTLASSYFHGSEACYGVLRKMSQDYLYRYPLVIPQGSLGTQEDNDLFADSRYTEAKPSVYADLLMEDYSKHPVPTKETYNGEYQEPVFLPGVFPNALCNGKETIAISLSHSSLPHNLSEVCDGILAYIQNSKITIQELMKYIKGPDFPLRSQVMNSSAIKTAFETGKSAVSLKVRGHYTITGDKIVFDTIPYRTYRNKIKEQLEKNVDKFEDCLEDFQDLSQVGENNLVFIAVHGKAEQLLQRLFEYTDLQNTVSYNMNFIIDGTPKLCSLKDLIIAYVKHQNNCLINITNTDLAKAQEKKHVLDGLLIVLKDIDKAISLIKNADNKDAARESLMEYFKLTEAQANAVLDMKLAKLTKLDRDDLLKQLEELTKAIAEYEKILTDEAYRNEVIGNKVKDLKDKYGDSRRTELLDEADTPAASSEKCTVIVSEDGAIKRAPQTKAKKGEMVVRTTTADQLMIFTNQGNMFQLLVNDISAKTSLKLREGEKPAVVYSPSQNPEVKYVAFITKNGLVKKTALEEYTKTKRKSGISATSLKENDELAAVFLLGDENIILITEKGMAIRFNSAEVAPSSRTTKGIKGITLKEGDAVSAAVPLQEVNSRLGIFLSSGYGKRISLDELALQKRGGKGVIIAKPKDNDCVAAVALLADKDNVLIVSETTSVRLSAKDIPSLGRTCLGNLMIKKGRIKSVSKI